MGCEWQGDPLELICMPAATKNSLEVLLEIVDFS